MKTLIKLMSGIAIILTFIWLICTIFLMINYKKNKKYHTGFFDYYILSRYETVSIYCVLLIYYYIVFALIYFGYLIAKML